MQSGTRGLSFGRRRRHTGAVLLVLTALAAAGAAAWWWLWPRVDPAAPTAEAFAAAWQADALRTAPWAPPTDPGEAAERLSAVAGDLGVPVAVTVTDVADPGAQDPDTRTTATLAVTWDVGTDQDWTADTTLDLVRVEDGWGVVDDPSIVHPDITEASQRVEVRRTRPERGDVVAADGTPLVTARGVVRVGIEPARVEDLDALAADLTGALRDTLEVDVDPTGLVADVEAADENAFVPVVTLREEDYLAVEEQIFPLPGTVFRRDDIPLAPTRDFARATLGSAGPVTAEILDEHPDRYEVGDVVGRSGLQAAYDERLFGTPGLEVVAVGDRGDDAVLLDRPAESGRDVTITLDERVQRAADAVVAGTGTPSALVAVRPSDGHVLAVANGPSGAGFDLGLQGRLAPGSTFKIVTTAALLDQGLDVDETVPCPPETTVGGRAFTNAEDEALGDVPFRTDFFRSCNTAFVQLSQRLTDDALAAAGRRLGFGREPALGVPAFLGEAPAADDPVDLAAAAIGQGRVQASPLAMATVAASVADGATVTPRLVLEPESSGASAAPEALDDGVFATLQELTRAVVTDGTGTALAGVPGPPVHGKTGTAEYAREDGTLGTHAWFVGFQDDLAFAVVVSQTPGDFGGAVAAPLAVEFLTTLAGS